MQFKTTIITGAFLLLISSLSIANPILQNTPPSQKTGQIQKQKPNFIQKIIFKKTKKKKKKGKERATSGSIISVILGSLVFLSSFLYLIYPWGLVLLYGGILITILGAIAVQLGSNALRNPESNNKTRKLGKVGIFLGLIGIGVTGILMAVFGFFVLRFLYFFFF